MGRARSGAVEERGESEVKAKIVMDTAGWKTADGGKTQYGDKGDVVMLPQSEFERLSAAGAVEKAERGDKLTSEQSETPGSAERAAEAIAAESNEPVGVTERQ